MISEVDSLMKNSKDILDSVDKEKQNVAAYEDILKALNPVYAKEQERDSAIESLTQQVDGIHSALERLETLLLRSRTNGND